MADWSGLQSGLVSGFQVGQKTGGRFAGLGDAISQVAEGLKNQREGQTALAQKQNLLGYEGLMKGTIAPAQPGDTGTVNVPGLGEMTSKGLPVMRMDASGNMVQVGTVPRNSKIINDKGLNNDQIDEAAKALVSGDQVPSQLNNRSNQKQIIIDRAKELDPNYSAAQADVNFAANKVGAQGMTKLYNMTKTSHDTFSKNADQALKESDNFPRSQIPLINSAILKGSTQITGNPQASRLLTAINTASMEYARLTSSPGSSSTVISDSARHEAQDLVAAWMNNGTLHGQLDPDTGIMRIDAQNRLNSVQDRYDAVRGGGSTNYKPIKASQPSGQTDYSNLWQ